MLGFLNSIILPLIAAVIIPVIIHFLNKQKTKEIDFSSLRFLKLIENKRIKRLRIYQILLIIIRMLFLLFLILAFARPTLKHSLWNSNASAHTTAVFILDDSYSMQSYTNSITYFSKAKNIMEDIFKTFNDKDKVYLLLPGKTDSNLTPLGHKINTEQYKVTYLTPDFSETLKQAFTILRTQVNFNRELYFISDFMINEKLLDVKIPEITLRSYLINLKNEELWHNAAIDSMYLKTNIFEAGKTVEVRIVLHNYNKNDNADVRVDLFSSDNRVAMEHFTLEGNEIREVALNYIPAKNGMQFLQAEINDDDLKADNIYYMNYLIPEDISLLLVDDSPHIFLNAALQALSEKTVIRLEKTGYTYFQGKDFNKYDIIILNDPKSISAATMRRLESFIDNNKAIFLIPGDNLSPDQLNATFNKKLYVTKKEVDNRKAYFAFNRKSVYHELFKPVFSKYNKEVDLPKIRQYFQINPKRTSTILSLKNGDAFLSRYSGKGFYLMSSSFSPEWNDFALKGLFVPMLYRILYAAVQHMTLQNNYTTGKSVKRIITDGGSYSKYILKDSDNHSYEIMPEQIGGKKVLNIKKLSRPGIYRLFKEGNFVDAFSVNVSSAELKAPYGDMEKIMPNVIWLSAEKDLKKQLIEARTGQELWLFFLALAIFMLFMEMLVIKKIEGKS